MKSRDLFEILVREHAAMLSVFLRSAVRDPGLADDLFQETVVAAWKALDRYDRDRPFGRWLRGIAARQVMAARRKQSNVPLALGPNDIEALEGLCHTVEHGPGDDLDERLELLRECVSRLPAEGREAIHARYHEALRGQVLAARLRLSTEATRKRLQRAREQLARCFHGKLADYQQELA
ncbi:MAG: sigma-70 family RNA polymerase sigma factor [Planctomycetota bacterium]